MEYKKRSNPSHMKTILVTFAAAFGLIWSSTAAHAERLVIKGSDTLGAKLVPQLAEQFKTQNPDATFDIAAEVGKNANGIGYVGLAYTKAQGIKVVSIDGAMPSVESVQKKSYPYARPTFYYTNGEPAGLVKAFVDFTLSSTGQKIVGDVGFVPIK